MAFGSMSPGDMGLSILQNSMKQPGAQQMPGGLLAAIQAAMSGNPTGGLAKSLFGGAQQQPAVGPPAPGSPGAGLPGGTSAMNPQVGLLAKMFPQMGMPAAPGPAMDPSAGLAAGMPMTGIW